MKDTDVSRCAVPHCSAIWNRMGEGKLFMFPSYVKHLAVPYRGKKDRIIVSFNSHVILPEST